MTLFDLPIWQSLSTFAHLSKGGRDNLDLLRLPDTLRVLALDVIAHCVACGDPIHPLRARVKSKRSNVAGTETERRLFYAATCPAEKNAGCARSRSAKDHKKWIRRMFSAQIAIKAQEPDQIKNLIEGWRKSAHALELCEAVGGGVRSTRKSGGPKWTRKISSGQRGQTISRSRKYTMNTRQLILVDLYKQMAEHTAPECGQPCGDVRENRCCDSVYCEFTIKHAKKNWGVDLKPTGHPTLPLMGEKGCVAVPHLRPVCTVHTCSIASIGCKRGDEAWTLRYFELREALNDIEVEGLDDLVEQV